MTLPSPLKKAIEIMARLPGIGPRQATRLAFFLINRGPEPIKAFAAIINELSQVKMCERCFFVHQNKNGLCDICSNPERRHGVIMIIEKETDYVSLENTGKFQGRYLVLGPIPKTGMLDDWQKARLTRLKEFVRQARGGQAEEIILGFNPTAIGDFNASLIEKELKPLAGKISRLGRGLPTGGEIEFADDDTLGSALERRG